MAVAVTGLSLALGMQISAVLWNALWWQGPALLAQAPASLYFAKLSVGWAVAVQPGWWMEPLVWMWVVLQVRRRVMC